MAILIGTNDAEGRLRPMYGPQFQHHEVQGLLEALELETIETASGRILVFDSKRSNKPLNRRASDLASASIYGLALLAERKELQWLQHTNSR